MESIVEDIHVSINQTQSKGGDLPNNPMRAVRIAFLSVDAAPCNAVMISFVDFNGEEDDEEEDDIVDAMFQEQRQEKMERQMKESLFAKQHIQR